jgi:hypothetical protein
MSIQTLISNKDEVRGDMLKYFCQINGLDSDNYLTDNLLDEMKDYHSTEKVLKDWESYDLEDKHLQDLKTLFQALDLGINPNQKVDYEIERSQEVKSFNLFQLIYGEYPIPRPYDMEDEDHPNHRRDEALVEELNYQTRHGITDPDSIFSLKMEYGPSWRQEIEEAYPLISLANY